MPYSSVLERASGTHKYSVQQELSLLTSTCSVVCLLPQAYSNKLRLAALEVPGFIFLWCLGAQRKGMVINMKNVIVVCGLNGAGKSTLGKALAEKLNYRFIDIEDIYFPKDNPEYKYLNPRPFEEVERILSNIISENNNFVLALVKGNFNKDIVSHFKCAVYIEAPKETRIKRVYQRSYNKFGERMLEGGDLYEKEKAFFDFVKSKDENTVEVWMSSISCPIIRVNGTLPIDVNVTFIANRVAKGVL